jgi:hypothetical protein
VLAVQGASADRALRALVVRARELYRKRREWLEQRFKRADEANANEGER